MAFLSAILVLGAIALGVVVWRDRVSERRALEAMNRAVATMAEALESRGDDDEGVSP